MEAESGMKIAKEVKRNLASIGYRIDQRPFHKEQLWLLFERMLTLLLQFVHALYIANTPREFMETIFMIMVGILMYITLVSTINEMTTIFAVIEDMEQVINESKYFIFILHQKKQRTFYHQSLKLNC